ncbi:MAG: DUF1365 family protein [Gammaproteobacteria bacterium]
MKSCIFKGQVRHRRFTPVDHAFSYKLFMMYVDLEELSSIFKRFLFWSFNKRNLAYFDRKDHIGNDGESLDKTIKNIIFDQTGKTHNGPIRFFRAGQTVSCFTIHANVNAISLALFLSRRGIECTYG